MSTEAEELKRQIEELETKRLRNELKRLQLAERAERGTLRKLEAAERAKRLGTININALREQITNGPLKNGRGAYSSQLSRVSSAWRRLLAMLRQPAESQQRLEAEGILRQLKVKYYDGDDRGKGYMRIFYYEPVDIPMMEPADVKIW